MISSGVVLPIHPLLLLLKWSLTLACPKQSEIWGRWPWLLVSFHVSCMEFRKDGPTILPETTGPLVYKGVTTRNTLIFSCLDIGIFQQLSIRKNEVDVGYPKSNEDSLWILILDTFSGEVSWRYNEMRKKLTAVKTPWLVFFSSEWNCRRPIKSTLRSIRTGILFSTHELQFLINDMIWFYDMIWLWLTQWLMTFCSPMAL